MAKSCPIKGNEYDICSESNCMFWDNGKCLIREYLKVMIKKTRIDVEKEEGKDLKWRDL